VSKKRLLCVTRFAKAFMRFLVRDEDVLTASLAPELVSTESLRLRDVDILSICISQLHSIPQR
jgi:hypothetical protein